MHLHENPSIDLLLKLIYLLLIAGGVWLFFHYIFGWVLPLVIAYLLSRLIQKPVAFLQQKCRLPRNMAAFLCTILTVGLLSWVVYFVLSRLFTEAFALFQALPAYLKNWTVPIWPYGNGPPDGTCLSSTRPFYPLKLFWPRSSRLRWM